MRNQIAGAALKQFLGLGGGRSCAAPHPYIIAPLSGVDVKCLFVFEKVKHLFLAETLKKFPNGAGDIRAQRSPKASFAL